MGVSVVWVFWLEVIEPVTTLKTHTSTNFLVHVPNPYLLNGVINRTMITLDHASQHRGLDDDVFLGCVRLCDVAVYFPNKFLGQQVINKLIEQEFGDGSFCLITRVFVTFFVIR